MRPALRQVSSQLSASSIQKRSVSSRFHGVYAPIPTPFHADGALNLEGLVSNLQSKYKHMPLKGLVVCGSNGEFPLMTYDERAKVLETAKRAESSGKQMLAGTGAAGLKETVELTKFAKSLGYDAAMVVTPYYFNSMMNDTTLIAYYRALANATEFPIIIYNIPQFSGTNISVAAVKQLASHPYIVGIKESGPIMAAINYARATVDQKDFAVLAGSGSLLLSGLMGGVDGAIIGLGNVRPKETTSVYNLFREGKLTEANAVQQQLVALNEALTTQYGVPALKEVLGQMGFAAGPPRSPLLPLNDAQKADVARLIRDYRLLE